MFDYEKYGIKKGQVYAPADGSSGRVVVGCVETFKDCGDVLIYPEDDPRYVRRIDAFKLAMVRYNLVDN